MRPPKRGEQGYSVVAHGWQSVWNWSAMVYILRDLPGCGTISCKLHTELLHAVQGWVSAIQTHTYASSCLLLLI